MFNSYPRDDYIFCGLNNMMERPQSFLLCLISSERMQKNADFDPRVPWNLKFDNMLPDLSWYWWWWIFFIDNPENPKKPKQLMILWSTKYTDDIKINDVAWSSKKLPEWHGNVLKFNGMTAAWWFDGKEMHEPLVLKKMDFEVTRDKDRGELRPICKDDYRFYGNEDEYRVNIVDDENDFRLVMTPWNKYLQEHRFKENHYTKKYSYNILKIYGMKLHGTIDGRKIKGSAYFQRVNVNAPAMPWYWGLVHCESGSFMHYFRPFIGPQMFRCKSKARSKLDWGDITLSKSLHFYHKETDTEYEFEKKDISVKHTFRNQQPVFYIHGEDNDKLFHLELEAYSRAHWRFQQRRKLGMRSILYYNEYPASVKDFLFQTKDGSLKVRKKDLGRTHANFEHSWGKLM